MLMRTVSKNKMKIIRIDRFNGKEEIVNNIHAYTIFTDEQYRDLILGIPQYTFGFVYQLDSEDKGPGYGTK